MGILTRRFGLAVLCLSAIQGIGPVAASPSTRAATTQVSEVDVKAAFLFNFTRFVEWPDAPAQPSAPFRMCVVADAATTAVIEKTMQGEHVNGRPSQTTVPASPDEVRACHILFVGRSESGRVAPLLAAVRDRPVLTVSDAERFTSRGGMIAFVREDDRVRFDVNLGVAKRSGLSLSSRLLRVARNVEGGK
jgi:hypothetical protein